jgi:Xaa-Pro aminopeptidase
VAGADFDRLSRDRLARGRMMMEKFDLGAIVCFVGENIRYITSVFQGNWKNNIFIRYWVLPRGGDPAPLRPPASTRSAPRSTPRG